MINPLVSIIVATYRREDVLWNALSSLSSQSYSNIEVVLVDDNDDLQWNTRVRDVVERFGEKYPSVRFQYIVNHPNRGSAETRNIGISVANGDYITFLDDDDVYLPDKVKQQVAFMEQKQLDYSITDLYLYNENGKLVDKRTRGYLTTANEHKLFECHMKYHITGTDAMMFRKDYIVKIGGFPPIDVGDEFHLMQRAIEHEGKFGYLPVCDIMAYVHTGEGGLSSGQCKIDGENQLYEYKKQFFPEFDKKAIRFIHMRHHAVLAFAYLRQRKLFSFAKESFLSFVSAPIECIMLFCRR